MKSETKDKKRDIKRKEKLEQDKNHDKLEIFKQNKVQKSEEYAFEIFDKLLQFPNQDHLQTLMREISQAQNKIVLCSYSFTYTPILKLLIDKYKNKVDIQIIVDEKNGSLLKEFAFFFLEIKNKRFFKK